MCRCVCGGGGGGGRYVMCSIPVLLGVCVSGWRGGGEGLVYVNIKNCYVYLSDFQASSSLLLGVRRFG